MLYNPSIIMKCLSTQATYVTKSFGQMFYFTDKGQVWYDTQNGGRLLASDIYVLQYERQRNNFIPSNTATLATEEQFISASQKYLYFTYVYVVETNCLYQYFYSSMTWSTVYGTYGKTTVAQTYLPDGKAVTISADDVSTNGILGDGSVVVRDANKMICGLLLSDGYTLTIESLIGGQINLEPSGSPNGSGCLQLNSDTESANLNNNLLVFGNVRTTKKENWAKQYRLVTENTQIISHSVIKKGSTMLAGSILNSTTYTSDTKLDADITVENNGLIVVGSKLYIGSVINNNKIKPPYLFDIDELESSSYVPSAIELPDNIWTISNDSEIKNDVLTINIESPFKNSGDVCYINTKDKPIQNVKIISFSDKSYKIDFISANGISNTAGIYFYSINGSVKIMP